MNLEIKFLSDIKEKKGKQLSSQNERIANFLIKDCIFIAHMLPRGFSRNEYIWAVMTMMGGSCGRKNGQTSIWYRSRQCVVSLVRLRSLLAS